MQLFITHTRLSAKVYSASAFQSLEWVLLTKALDVCRKKNLQTTGFPTWKNLAEKVHFLLEVSMRELLVSWLHKILAGVEEILQKQH